MAAPVFLPAAPVSGDGNFETDRTRTHHRFNRVVTVDRCGALPDGSDSLGAFQDGVDWLTAKGGGSLIVDQPIDSTEQFFLDGSLEMKNNVELVGPGTGRGSDTGEAGTHLLVGNGVDPMFVAGTDPGDNAVHRQVVLRSISARNNGAPVVSCLTGINWHLLESLMESFNIADEDSGTVVLRNSYRAIIRAGRYNCTGGGWGLTARHGSNALSITDRPLMSGGDLGGACDISGCQSVEIASLDIETSKRGLWLASTGVGTDGGNVQGARIGPVYFEAVESPIVLGDGLTVQGLHMAGWRVSNGGAVGAGFTPLYVVRMGRVTGFTIEDYFVARTGTLNEPVFQFAKNASAPFWAGGGKIRHGDIDTHGPFMELDSSWGATPTDWWNRIIGNNEISPQTGIAATGELSTPASGLREYTSGVLTASSAVSNVGILAASVYGARVLSIEIIEATGTLGCTVKLGSTTSNSEILNLDPSTLTYVNGCAKYTGFTQTYLRTGSPMLLSLVTGAGTGTFRVRVRYWGLDG